MKTLKAKDRPDIKGKTILFENDLRRAVEIIQGDTVLMQSIFSIEEKYQWNIIAVVIPEMIRCDMFQEFIDKIADENIYINFGKGDCPIGIFQMRSSFIDTMERYVFSNKLVECYPILISAENEKEARRERIKRLKRKEWQVRYAWAYWQIVSHRFIGLDFKGAVEQIRFFAAAYNYGFREPVQNIRKWERKKAFPFGLKYVGEQIAYADLSIEFLKKYAGNDLKINKLTTEI
jgi:hypothetical protein